MNNVVNNKKTTRKLTELAMLAAVGIVLTSVVPGFPIIPGAGHLLFDFADIPIAIGAFMYGPISGLIITAIVSLFQALTTAAGDGLYGAVMHFLATGSYVLVAGLIYKNRKTRKRAAIAMGAGTLTMCIVMIPANMFLTPIYLEQVRGMVPDLAKTVAFGFILPAVVPFNLIKAGVNSVLTFFIYKPLRRFILRD